jgi:hypothetical protein
VNFGRRLILIYGALYYFFPLVGNVLFADEIFTIYKVVPLEWHSVAMLFLTLISYLFLDRMPRVRVFPKSMGGLVKSASYRLTYTYARYRVWIALISFVLAVPYMYYGLNSYRYSNVGISESGSVFSVIVALVNLLGTIDLFYQMFVRDCDEDVESFKSARGIGNILFSLMLVLTANGTGSVLNGLVSLCYSVWPTTFVRLIYVDKKQTLIRQLRRLLLAAAGVVGVFCVAWLAGETVKLSSSAKNDGLVAAAVSMQDLLVDSPDIVENYGYYLISAFSSHYYSLLFASTVDPRLLNGERVSAVFHPIETLFFRFDLLSGGLIGLQKPEYGSLSRLNYELLSDESQLSARQGTSPGLLGSFMYIFPLPLAALVCAVYMVWVGRLTNELLCGHEEKSLSVFGQILLLLYMLTFFQSPLDLLMFFDNAVLYIALICLIAAARQNRPGLRVIDRRRPLTKLAV